MTYVVITVAGMSARFNRNTENPVLKCIYYDKDPRKTLLYSILRKCVGCKGVIIVGGYQFPELEKYVACWEKDFPFDIRVVFNPYFDSYGSGYSLKIGLQECLKQEMCTDILLIEGDLLFDQKALEQMINGKKNYLTINSESIFSEKAVAVYVNGNEEIRYIYNTEHGLFHIKEPFSVIYNSGQVWKFSERGLVEQVIGSMEDSEWQSTNLKFVELYFNKAERSSVEIVKFQKWVNCNTRLDYLNCEKEL